LQSLTLPKKNDLVTLTNTGKVRVAFHSGQARAWDSVARFVFVFAGTQGGKTSFVPWWLNREILRTADPAGNNDYLAVTASYDLFKLKFLPELRKVFEQILRVGKYWAGPRVIELKDPDSNQFWATRSDDAMWGRIILRSAQSDGGLESATAKAAILDECGQDEFRVDHWEAIQRRLSISQGRALGATTLYNRGWVKTQVYDEWRAGNPDYEVVQFASHTNPSFPEEEYNRIVATLPRWKVNMFYKGEFDIPPGLIYDCFNEDLVIGPIPTEGWTRYGGIDFGGVHTAALCYAEDPDTGNLFLIKEYLKGGRTAKEHAQELKTWGCRMWVGGAHSEDQWRKEFAQAKMPILAPTIKDVEVGIDRVYAQHKADAIYVFNTCTGYLDEKRTYSRKLDRDGQVTEKIADKETFHRMDAERYIIGKIRPGGKTDLPEDVAPQQSKWSDHDAGQGSRWKKYG
jgi:hypothetical protein